MKYLIHFLCAWIVCLDGISQPFHLSSENAYITSGAYSTNFRDAFSFASNPACIGNSKRISLGILTERKWMLKELGCTTMAASFNLGNDGLGVLLQQNGDADYNEQYLELAYGKNLGKASIGISFGYQLDRATGYQGVGFGSSDIGVQFHVSEKLIVGWDLGLPVFGEVGKLHPEKGPQFFRMGFGYEWRTDLFLAVEIVKSSGVPLNVISSLEYRYGEHFFFSFGLNSNNGSPYFKTGWKKNKLCIQVYTIYEQVLGFSPGLVLLWDNKNRSL
jgi:hypothetical protein